MIYMKDKPVINMTMVLLVLLFLAFLTGCQIKTQTIREHDETISTCTVTKQDFYTVIACPDGTGATILDGVAGPKGDQGDKGETGSTGAKGNDGSIGLPGRDGQDGAPGVDTAPTTIVQFCPGSSTYPSVFPEVGLCIQNKLYGVFWINGSAFMGEIPPGAYISTSTSLPCNFTVSVNCQVTN